MNRLFICGFFLIAIISCQSTDKKSTSSNDALPQTLESFADSLVRLDKYSIESLDVAADYFQRLVPADTIMADSAAVIFLRYLNSVVDTTNQKIYQDTADYFQLVYNQSQNVSEYQKQFQSRLNKHHILLQADGEGGVYGALDYSWINNVLQARTSAAVDNYLYLVAKEEKNPTLLDAGLAINVHELVDRLITSEQLAKTKLPSSFLADVEKKKEFYTATMIVGSINSPAVDFESLDFTDEFIKGYNYLQTTYPSSEAAKMVAEWQAIIKSKDSKKIEEWRSRYNLYE